MKIGVVLCFFLMASQALAQGLGSSSVLQQDIKVGQVVAVQFTDGREMKGSVSEVTDAELAIVSRGRTERIAAPRIKEVSLRRKDSLTNGLIIGAIAGALSGFALAFANDCDFNECGESAYVPGGIAIGAAAGVGIDFLRRQKQVLYRAPQSQTTLRIYLLLGQATGAKVSWRF